ncbi:retrovirus-related pol polyprotein from transposon TNT 1-94 [Tanacetum coccineum]|uniref:Retrovirus-related pol polyprotein from transposon TNT 1-94 n=1 Tax=Tanacetum coccineum TaxID=301880 RepID=A0ABQ5EVT0_9ASTR
MLNLTFEPSYTPSVIVDVPSELPKVSLVNASLKKLKFYLTQFDSVVKKRTTLSAIEEGEWGFEHTKTIFNNEIIPFLKSLKDIFNVFDKDLLNEITKVQSVFDQIEASVHQFLVDKKCLEIAKKEILLENDRLLQKIMSQDVMLIVMNSMSLNNNYVNMEMLKCDSYEKCLNLDDELSKSKQAYNDILKNHSQLEQHCISLEVSMQLKQELQDKDKTICKLKDTSKSLRENTKTENVNHDKWEIEPINKELENSVAKLLYKNERLCNEINHVKQVFKDQFDSIKKTRVRHKEQSDSLINKLNLKFVEIEDLKAQIQDKVFVITSLKNDLRKLKGKEIVENVIHTPSTTTIAPGMFKLDLEPLPPSELDLACKYATRIQELLIYVQDTCPNALIPSAKKVTVKPMNNVKKVRNKKNKVEARPRKLNKVNRVIKPLCDVDVKHSLSKANSEILCVTCNKSMFDVVHDKCLLDLVQNGNKCTLRFENDQIARIIGYGDYQLGNVIISKVYYVEGLGHNLFSVGQFCDTDLEVAFRKNTSFIRNLEAHALGKSKKSSHKPKAEDTNQEKLYLLHMDLYGPMRVASINGKRRNQTLIEAARTMRIFSKALLFLWDKAINTAYYAQNRSLIRIRYNKTPYELMQDKKLDLSFFHVFGSLYYPTNDHEDLGKFDAKADIGIFVGYALSKKAFRIYNKRTWIITETIHVMFDELTTMASKQFSSGPRLQGMTPATSSIGLGSNPVSQQPCLPPIRDDWDRLFQPMFDEYFNPPTIVVSLVSEAAALRAEVLADSPVSISINQDAPSTSIPSSQEQEHSPIIS